MVNLLPDLGASGSAASLPPAQPPERRPENLPGADEDIDAADKANATACAEYVQEIYAYQCELENRNLPVDYMPRQSEVNEHMRERIVDWICSLHYRFQFQIDALFHAISLLDRFLSVKVIAHSRLQLVGLTALVIASKYEDSYTAPLSQFAKVAEHPTCSIANIVQMEREFLLAINFGLSAPTSLTFLKRYAKAAKAETNMGMLSRFMAELTLGDYKLTAKYRPSLIASAAIYHARRLMQLPGWTPTLAHYSGYREADFEQCAVDLRDLVKKAAAAKFVTTYRKYSLPKYWGLAPRAVSDI